MARVIKRGRCNFTVFQTVPASGSDKEQDAACEDFNCLSGLLPDKEEGKAECEPQVQSEAETRDLVAEAKEQAKRILEEAEQEAARLKAEAEEIVSTAKKNAEEIESQAYTLGYEQGSKDGEELGRKQFEIGLQHLENLIESFKKETAGLSRAYEAQMVQISLLVAKAMVEKELASDKELISRVLTKAMNKTVEGSLVKVHINPRDFENLGEDFIARLSGPGGNRVEFQPDGSVTRGGCMIETDFGLVDASVESRWQSIMEDIGRQLFERTEVELPEEILTIEESQE